MENFVFDNETRMSKFIENDGHVEIELANNNQKKLFDVEILAITFQFKDFNEKNFKIALDAFYRDKTLKQFHDVFDVASFVKMFNLESTIEEKRVNFSKMFNYFNNNSIAKSLEFVILSGEVLNNGFEYYFDIRGDLKHKKFSTLKDAILMADKFSKEAEIKNKKQVIN